MRDVREWLAAAGRLYDTPTNGLAARAREVSRAGFAGGAEWMRHSLFVLRGWAPSGHAAFDRLGVAKYAMAGAAALAVAAVLASTVPWLVPLAVLAFYVVEVRMVFAFPLALDGSRRPLRDSHRLLARATPPLIAVGTVMRIATEMLFGGLLGRGFVRSWCIGCLAVVLWYEDARTREATA